MQMCHNRSVTVGLWWDDENAEHIRERSVRYPGAPWASIPLGRWRQQPTLKGSLGSQTRRVDGVISVSSVSHHRLDSLSL
nr:hypothetical protein [Kibdelosporangium sp. MJ126-NF4]CTQ92055.1 hypothetical protein [Kibdelosporangium sp. MJ126-NF4]